MAEASEQGDVCVCVCVCVCVGGVTDISNRYKMFKPKFPSLLIRFVMTGKYWFIKLLRHNRKQIKNLRT